MGCSLKVKMMNKLAGVMSLSVLGCCPSFLWLSDLQKCSTWYLPTCNWLELEMSYKTSLIWKTSGVVIIQIENKSAPLRVQKIINPPQNRTLNFQKLPYFKQKWANICQNIRISFKIMLNIGKILTFVSKKHKKK